MAATPTRQSSHKARGFEEMPMMNLIICVLLTVLGHVGPSCPMVTCRTSPTVQEGGPSRVSCLFVRDLRENKTDFSIFRFPQESLDKPEKVLDCTYKENRAYPSCKTAAGYNFEGEFGTQVTLSIPNTTKGHEGTYVCESEQPEFLHSRVCSLQVNKANTTLSGGPSNETSLSRCYTQSPVTEGEPSFIKCSFTEDPNVTKHNFRLLRYELSDNDTLPEQVMDCTWLGDTPSCRFNRGYISDNHVAKEMTVTIPKATLKHAGKYECQESIASTAESTCCLLEVQNLAKVARATTCVTSDHVELGKTASVTCVYPFDIRRNGTDVGIDHQEFLEDGSVSPFRRQIVHFNRSACTSAKSYKYVQSENSSKLEMRIDRVEPYQLGQYVCRLLSASPGANLQNCSLILSNVTDPGSSLNTVKIAVLSVVCGLVVPAVIIGMILWLRKRRRQNNSDKNQGTAEEEATMNTERDDIHP